MINKYSDWNENSVTLIFVFCVLNLDGFQSGMKQEAGITYRDNANHSITT